MKKIIVFVLIAVLTVVLCACPAIHAEQNALMSAGRQAIGATLYIAGWDGQTGQRIADAQPCEICARFIKNAGIARVVTAQSVQDPPTPADIITHQEATIHNLRLYLDHVAIWEPGLFGAMMDEYSGMPGYRPADRTEDI